MTSFEFEETKGDYEIYRLNQRKFEAIFIPLLKQAYAVEKITGHQVYCSPECKGKDAKLGHAFLDESRFTLSCGHASLHIQCLVSYMRLVNLGGYAFCPVGDRPECREGSSD